MKSYRTLRDHDLQLKKGLGQHILVDPRAVTKIVDAAELDENDTVLEVGPGPGTLTVALAQRAGRVIAVEIDAAMLPVLQELVGDQAHVQVVHGDILEQDIHALIGDGPYKVVANLPYYITSAVLRHLLASSPRPQMLVLTVQREVADRIVGRPERQQRHKQSTRMSLLAVSVQFYGQPRILARIPAGAFRPSPAVDSAVVRLDVYDPLPWGEVDEETFFRVARAGFAQSRKQLRNALKHGLGLSDEKVDRMLSAAEVDGRRRAETLSIPEWVRLSRASDELSRQ